MRVLLTNDDGIEAPGLQALHEAARNCFGETVEIVVVAPNRGRSECGHSVTTGRALRFERVRPGWISVDGTPVDCVRAALASLIGEVDLVLSGVNAGANLGIDLLVSGTFAAAREAALHSVPAMAISHYRRPDVPVTWDHVPRWMKPTLETFVAELPKSAGKPRESTIPLWNVNLPAIDPGVEQPEIANCDVDTRPMHRAANHDGEQLHLTTDFHGRPREQGRDVELCFSGRLSVSKLPYPFGW
ncbi:MAG: 5'/3'-nucleotidase SurE [Rubripirellula sp.]